MSTPSKTGTARAHQVPAAPPSRPRGGEVTPLAPRLPGFRGGLPWGIVRALRPRQWVKNGLVLASPLAAGAIFEPDVLGPTAIAFVVFCLASSGIYVINDLRDIEEDRRHPRKRFRAIPAGVVPIPLAIVMAVVLLVVSLGGAVLLTRWQLAGVVGSYVVISICYSFFLKNQPVIDLAVVASGFLLRGVAGGVAAGIELSQWFLLVAAFGSLFMVAGKRGGEHLDLGDDRTAIRATLAAYSRDYLRYVWTMASGVTLTAYCLWAFEEVRPGGFLPWYELTIAPFVIWILRYALLLESGKGATPEDIVLGDRTLQVVSFVWVALFAAAVYVGR